MSTTLIVVLVLVIVLVAVMPTWPHSTNWGNSPVGVVATILIVLLLLHLLKVI